ncbi:hypothetical protein [Sphingomonas nostoxanthinifaciens]|uniref:hypothetical protein n=1 Tax=Sphingomonas nostoxanthinifaciens TaxID=2872652 RepID=UPI001CC1DF2E|nr:hypothetical protein [Sphingomonas nostoxanthinifaciens]UAK23244.1 hypothetical protein K8P63_12585 [Sphingomonas nostoxanthinifaciens]
MNAPLFQRDRPKARRRSVAAIFAVPALIGTGTALGLTVGLLGQGGWDVIACLCLAPPVILALVLARGR